MRRQFIWSLLIVSSLLASAPAKTQAWIEVRTPHFVVLSDSNEKQTTHVADQLERMRAVFHKVFPQAQVDPGSPIIVIAVKNKKDFQALEPEAYLAKGQLELAGLFLRGPDKNYILLRLDAEGPHPYATVYHEYTHLLESRAEEWLPLWFNEGLAQFYENTDIHDKEVLLGQPSGGELGFLREKRLIPLPTLFAVDRNSPYYHQEDKGSIFYAQSWALTHYLYVKDFKDKTNLLTQYAELVGNNVDPVTAATRTFGDLKKLQSDLERYISQGTFSAFRIAGNTEVDESTFRMQPVPTTQADAMRADFLAYDQRLRDAHSLLDRVLHDDPNNVSAHETMGSLASREGKFDDALKWYEQAVGLDSQNFLAHYYFASMAMRATIGDNKRDAQIESSLRTAIKLNPSFPGSYDQLAMFYGMRHKNLDEAHHLNLLAVELEPGNVGFRINTANVLMQMERSKDAITVLQNAMKLTKSPEETAMVQSQLESIQQYQAARESAERDYQRSVQENAAAQQSEAEPQSVAAEANPSEDKHGPRRSARGTLKNVRCPQGTVMQLNLESVGKQMSLRARNYYKVEFTALGFTPSADLNPCKDLEGMKAKVEFFEAADKASEGQIISIKLSK